MIPYFKVSVMSADLKVLLLVLCCHHHTNLNTSLIFPVTAVNKGMLFPFLEAEACLYSECLCRCSIPGLGIECPGPDVCTGKELWS